MVAMVAMVSRVSQALHLVAISQLAFPVRGANCNRGKTPGCCEVRRAGRGSG
jgi:hypothetical protein